MHNNQCFSHAVASPESEKAQKPQFGPNRNPAGPDSGPDSGTVALVLLMSFWGHRALWPTGKVEHHPTVLPGQASVSVRLRPAAAVSLAELPAPA